MFDYDPHIPRVHGDEHIRQIHLESISPLAPYSGIILTVVCVVLFLIKQFVLEGFLLRRLYGERYTKLKDIDRRGFANHHIAGATKLLLLIVGVYPFIDVAFRNGTLNKPYAPGSRVTMGDILCVCTSILTGMYIFELIYRVKISLISSLHHVGSVIIAQTAIAYSLDRNNARVAVPEFILVTVWGAFDIVCEMLPHISIVLYRIYKDSHRFLSRVFFVAAVTTFGGTLFETAVVFYLWGSLWNTWTLEWKIVTPLLHVAFSATQLHGSIIFYKMWKRQLRLLREDRNDHLEDGGLILASNRDRRRSSGKVMEMEPQALSENRQIEKGRAASHASEKPTSTMNFDGKPDEDIANLKRSTSGDSARSIDTGSAPSKPE